MAAKKAARLAIVPPRAPEPGPESTQQERNRWDAEIRSFLAYIEGHRLNVHGAADYLRRMDPPLSPEATAWLAWWAIHMRQKIAGSHERNRDVLGRELRKILSRKPTASTDEVYNALRARCHGQPLDDVAEDGTVTWYEGGRDRSATRKQVVQRISRLRPKDR